MKQHRTIKLSLLVLGILMSLLMVILVSRLVQQSPLTINGWVGHTQQVYREIQSILIATLDAETGQRGYVITDNPEYLKFYHGARARVDKHLKRLSYLTRDNPVQQERVGELQMVLDHKFVELNRTLRELKTGGKYKAVVVVNEHVGLQDMRHAREITDILMKEEDRLLVLRNKDAYILFYCILFCIIGVIGRDIIFLTLWHTENKNDKTAEGSDIRAGPEAPQANQ